MKDIIIVGAGGFGREVQWLIERINIEKSEWNFIGYIDDGIEKGKQIDDYPVLGGCEYLLNFNKEIFVVIAIGSSKIRKAVAEKLKRNQNIKFPNLIDPDATTSSRYKRGIGNIICAGTVMTTDYSMGDFNIINLDCTIGHDAKIESYVTVYPSVNISGCVAIGSVSEIGTGSNIIQGIHIGEKTIIGAGSVVVRDIEGCCTAMGVPCKPSISHKEKR